MSEKVIYTGHFLTNPEELLVKLPPQITGDGSTIYAHHVTKEFGPADGKDGVTPGRERIMRIIGHVVADGVHAALVEAPDDGSITKNRHAHITIATAAGVPAVRSNDVLAAAIEAGTVIPINPPIEVQTVEGYVGDDNQVHTN